MHASECMAIPIRHVFIPVFMSYGTSVLPRPGRETRAWAVEYYSATNACLPLLPRSTARLSRCANNQ